VAELVDEMVMRNVDYELILAEKAVLTPLPPDSRAAGRRQSPYPGFARPHP